MHFQSFCLVQDLAVCLLRNALCLCKYRQLSGEMLRRTESHKGPEKAYGGVNKQLTFWCLRVRKRYILRLKKTMKTIYIKQSVAQ